MAGSDSRPEEGQPRGDLLPTATLSPCAATKSKGADQSEVNTLNKRRAADHQIALELESEDTHGEKVKRPTATSDVIGLALSGGGVRSASFCLGALQALNRAGALHKIDYLSTVSGGGYIGSPRPEWLVQLRCRTYRGPRRYRAPCAGTSAPARMRHSLRGEP